MLYFKTNKLLSGFHHMIRDISVVNTSVVVISTLTVSQIKINIYLTILLTYVRLRLISLLKDNTSRLSSQSIIAFKYLPCPYWEGASWQFSFSTVAKHEITLHKGSLSRHLLPLYGCFFLGYVSVAIALWKAMLGIACLLDSLV